MVPQPLAVVPDGRVIVLEKGGAVRVLQNGVAVAGSALNLPVCSTSERWLLRVALDPDFNANGRVFLFSTRPSSSAPGGCATRGHTPATPTTICQEIFAYGLRNPWRFAFDPHTGATR